MHRNSLVAHKLTHLSLLLLAGVAVIANCKQVGEAQSGASQVKAVGSQPLPLSDDQLRELNELLRQYDTGAELSASPVSPRNALADALSNTLSAQRNSLPLESALEVADELQAEQALQAARDEQAASDALQLAPALQAYLPFDADASLAEKRAPNSSNNNGMGSAYLLPVSVASYKRPAYGKNAFDFGLGKRQSEPQLFAGSASRFGEPSTLVNPTNLVQATGHQFGKRPNAHRFDFGLGKRKATYPRFDFGLGKRSV